MSATAENILIDIPDTNAVIELNVTEAALVQLEKKYAVGFVENATYKDIVIGIAEIRPLRTGVENQRKELKAPYFEMGKKIDARAKEVTARLTALEDPMRAAKKAVDGEKAKAKAEKEAVEKKRIESIQNTVADNFGQQRLFDLQGKSPAYIESFIKTLEAIEVDDSYQEFKNAAQFQKDEALKIASTLLSSAKRIEEQEAEQEAEKAKLEAEALRLKEESRKLEEAKAQQQKEAQDKQNKLDAEQRKLDAEKQVIEDAKANEAKEKADKLKAEQAAKEKAEQDERDKIKAEEDAVIAAEREEALKPDIEKLALWALTLQDIEGPEVNDHEVKVVIEKAANFIGLGVACINEYIGQRLGEPMMLDDAGKRSTFDDVDA